MFGVIFNECLMFNKIMNPAYFPFNFEGICNDTACIQIIFINKSPKIVNTHAYNEINSDKK